MGVGVDARKYILRATVETTRNNANQVIGNNGRKGIDLIMAETSKGHENGHVGKYGQQQKNHRSRIYRKAMEIVLLH